MRSQETSDPKDGRGYPVHRFTDFLDDFAPKGPPQK
jgi:hypothetical protein